MFTSLTPNNSTFQTSLNHSTSGRILSIALSADPNRIYAGSVAGFWRSNDAGLTFGQLTGPLTDTAGPGIFGVVYAPHIFDLAASPTDPNLVLAAARDGQFVISRDGIYRTSDGGLSWELVLVSSTVSQILFAPDDPSLVYAALGFGGVARSTDAGKTWTLHAVGGNAWHVAVAPLEGPGVRKVYAAGDSAIFFSPDGGNTWSVDNGVSTINTARSKLAVFQQGTCKSTGPVNGFGGMSATNSGSNAQTLAVEPGNPAKVYLATEGGAFGPCFYDGNIADGTLVNTDCKRLAGEGSLWYGDFSQFGTTKAAQWVQLPGPPVYSGGGDTQAGTCVITKSTNSGFLVFFSDMGHVHVSQGVPTAKSWHRLGGEDIPQARKDGKNRNVMVVHADPHGLIFTPDFEITPAPPAASVLLTTRTANLTSTSPEPSGWPTMAAYIAASTEGATGNRLTVLRPSIPSTSPASLASAILQLSTSAVATTMTSILRMVDNIGSIQRPHAETAIAGSPTSLMPVACSSLSRGCSWVK
jgi:hypothetical protein